ncbi:MAG: twin-arginine translocase TatA/TatE family subunit [Eggerthellaceae bacterium]|nr:twin-arginine translocase TatA/TatE family subunit [Eggerthellaceae bacterium]
MKFGGMGGLELVIILVVVLVIFGPKNLPKLGKSVGQSISSFREGLGGSDSKPNPDQGCVECGSGPASDADYASGQEGNAR